jgi:hypothetical protein
MIDIIVWITNMHVRCDKFRSQPKKEYQINVGKSSYMCSTLNEPIKVKNRLI